MATSRNCSGASDGAGSGNPRFRLFPFAPNGFILRGFDQPRSLAMIVLPVVMLMAAAGAGPVAPSHERQAFGQCLSRFVHDKLEAKLDAAAFKAAEKAACAEQEAAFRNAWVAFDVAMKTRRSEAEENAAGQIDDYFSNSADSYASSIAPPARPGHSEGPTPAAATTAAATVTPASATTPPKP